MSPRSWIRRLFARTPRTVRKAPARRRPTLEALENRLVPAYLAVTPMTDAANPWDGIDVGEWSTPALGDVDGDGDLDLLVPMASAAAVGWHENVAGNATVWVRHTIATGVAGPRSVSAVDVDRDGDLDALVPSQNDNTVAWHENLAGDGTLWTKRTIATDASAVNAAMAADLDGDGDPDVASAWFNGGTIAWYRNATIHESACFVPEHLISTAAAGAQSLVPADVDGDGDLDGVSTAFLGDTVAWHENIGGGAAVWATRTITTAFDQAARVSVGDVDRDGDVDVAAVQGNFANGALTWFDNTAGNGSAWTAHTVSTVFGRATHVELVDLSGDGDLDLLGAGYYTSPTRWFENAAGNGTTWTPGTLPTGVQTGMATGDIDGDGDPDVASAESFFGDGMGWSENTAGNGSAWTNHTISTQPGVTYAMAAADMDGDGDLDVLQPGIFPLLGITAWYENVGGSGASWTQHGIPGSDGSVIATAHDLDRDGDPDVIQTGDNNGVRWFENTAGNGTAWTPRTLSPAAGTPGGLSVADLDGDGDPDVLSATAITNTLAWQENQAGQAAIAVVSQAPPTAINSEVVSMLRATVTHLGRPGDGPLELASLGLRFEESPGDPLTTAEANALVESLRVYRDANANGIFEPATDVLVTTIGTLALTAGVQTVPFTDGDPNVQVVQGTSVGYFVVVELTATASGQVPNQLMVTLLQVGPSASVLEDRTFDIPLRLACPADVSSTIKQAVPVELIGFSVE
jgi:FG-GAP-like repeat